MKMHENSMFAVLLRSPWWISFAVAGITIALSRMVVLKFDFHELYSVFVALPFLVVGTVAAWRQLRVPSAARTEETLAWLRSLGWDEFSAALENAYRRDGYEVTRLNLAGADLQLTKGGRVSLVGGRRWKVARGGIEPLRELDAARQARDAHDCIYVAAGDITDNARAFATEKKIRLLQDAELASLLPRPKA